MGTAATAAAAATATGPSRSGPTPLSVPAGHDTDTPMADRADGSAEATGAPAPGAQPQQPPTDGASPAAGDAAALTAAANGQPPTDAAAAVAALAPRAFLPLSDGELAAITPETAQDFQFRLPPPASPAPGPQQQQQNDTAGGQDTAMAEALEDAGKGATGGGGEGNLAPGHAGVDAAAAAGSADGTAAAGGNTGGPGVTAAESGGGGGGSGDSGLWGVAEAREALLKLDCLPASARARATEAWVANHFRWVVWKLAAYERRCVVRVGRGRILGL